MLSYCANLKAIRYKSTSLNRIVADKSHRVIVACVGSVERAKFKGIIRHHGSCGPSLTGKPSSVSSIFTHGTCRNVKNR